jgi:23S rRNA pseudouridine1911/1915/1917 synthase
MCASRLAWRNRQLSTLRASASEERAEAEGTVYPSGMGDRAERALGDVRVLLEDNHLLVVDKPAGLLTQAAQAGDDCLLERGREYIRIRYDKPGQVFLGLVHRLDRNVSGVVVLARTSKAASRLSRAFASRAVEKRYTALVVGQPVERRELTDRLGPRAEGRGVERRPDGKEARLRFERLVHTATHAALEVELLTGRKHQVRAQLALAGHPIYGDPLYGASVRSLRRPALHAHRLVFEHPVRKEPVTALSPLPMALVHAARALGLPLGEQQF